MTHTFVVYATVVLSFTFESDDVQQVDTGVPTLREEAASAHAAIFGEEVGIRAAQQRDLSEQPRRHLMRLNIDMGGGVRGAADSGAAGGARAERLAYGLKRRPAFSPCDHWKRLRSARSGCSRASASGTSAD